MFLEPFSPFLIPLLFFDALLKALLKSGNLCSKFCLLPEDYTWVVDPLILPDHSTFIGVHYALNCILQNHRGPVQGPSRV